MRQELTPSPSSGCANPRQGVKVLRRFGNYVPIFRVVYTVKMGTELVPGASNLHTWRGCGSEKKISLNFIAAKASKLMTLLPTVGRCDFWLEMRCSQELFSICEMKYMFQVCKSVHHYTVSVNQPTRCNNFSSLLLNVYVQLNMFRASSLPSSGAQQLQ
jgi:hypothetical protein